MAPRNNRGKAKGEKKKKEEKGNEILNLNYYYLPIQSTYFISRNILFNKCFFKTWGLDIRMKKK